MKPALQTNLVPQIITLLGFAFDSKYGPHFRMANSIIEIVQNGGNCLPQDLLARGFSKSEIDERWHLASAMANVELRLMENKAVNRLNTRVLFG